MNPATGKGTVLDETVVLPDKRVFFSAESFGEVGEPKEFVLEEVDPPGLGWLVNRVARTNLGSFRATTILRGPRKALSDVVPLPEAGIRGRRSFRFYDARDVNKINPSPKLTIAKLGNIDLSASLPETGIPDIFATRDVAQLKALIQWAKDPKFRVIVMTSFGAPGPELKEFVERYVAERGLTLSAEAQDLFRQPPNGWSVVIDVTWQVEVTINGQPVTVPGAFGQPGVPFEFPFRINTPGRGKALCAVKVIDLEHPENVIFSDVIGLERKS